MHCIVVAFTPYPKTYLKVNIKMCTYFCPPVNEFDGLVQGELNINPETDVDID